ncbi:hypothetical protein F4804DRAFT_347941 [Jackrogersella minutella]|nr:hypothetical protein F4804DRAFT_347941 [Jackrogersella minutella]
MARVSGSSSEKRTARTKIGCAPLVRALSEEDATGGNPVPQNQPWHLLGTWHDDMGQEASCLKAANSVDAIGHMYKLAHGGFCDETPLGYLDILLRWLASKRIFTIRSALFSSSVYIWQVSSLISQRWPSVQDATGIRDEPERRLANSPLAKLSEILRRPIVEETIRETSLFPSEDWLFNEAEDTAFLLRPGISDWILVAQLGAYGS